MKTRKVKGSTEIRIEDIKEWRRLARVVKDPSVEDVERWEKFIELIHQCWKGDVPKVFNHGIMVLVPKSSPGEYRGIGLLEHIHKLISQIINQRLKHSIKFDDSIHGNRSKRGCHTAIGELKLLMQLKKRSTKNSYATFIDFSKAFDSIDRETTLWILEQYNVGSNIRNYIANVWLDQKFTLRHKNFLSSLLDIEQGVTQGDTDSPIIFNIVVDAVVAHWKRVKNPNPYKLQETFCIFYVDDGVIVHDDKFVHLQEVNLLVDLFEKVGLKTNIKKTKFMIINGGEPWKAICTEAYNKMMTGNGKSYRERQKEKVKCKHCDKILQ